MHKTKHEQIICFFSQTKQNFLKITFWPHRQCGSCKILLCHLLLLPPPSFLLRLLCFLSSASPVLWLSTNAVQLAVPIGDDGQLMSGASSAWPVLWLSTDAVQLAVPIGDDGQLMSAQLLWPARPMA